VDNEDNRARSVDLQPLSATLGLLGRPRGRRAGHGVRDLPRCLTTRLRSVAPERQLQSSRGALRRTAGPRLSRLRR